MKDPKSLLSFFFLVAIGFFRNTDFYLSGFYGNGFLMEMDLVPNIISLETTLLDTKLYFFLQLHKVLDGL